MNKINVVIASVLKPVDDTRMFEKFALTLLEEQKYHIHIIGFYSKQKKFPEFISTYPIFNFSRMSLKRFVAPWKYYKLLVKLRPSIVISTTPELQLVTIMYKILFGCKILYDVQENYLYNSLYSGKFRPPLNFVIGYLMRTIEYVAMPFTSCFILAEKVYQYELPFLNGKFVVVENKYKHMYVEPHERKPKSIFHLLYSGTISKSYGIYRAINLVVQLNKVDPRFKLTIIGFCPDKVELNKILNVIKEYDFIYLLGGNELVSHSLIVSAIKEADLGLVSYEYNRSTVNRIPTKLYEYIYNRLPILLTNNPLWESFCRPYNAAFIIDFEDVKPLQFINSCLEKSFYNIPFDVYPLDWDSTKDILKKCL